MVQRVAQTIARHAMFHAGERVGVAVSGGPDSTALLLALHELAPALGVLPGVVHLNHKLRGIESDADEAFAAGLAVSLGLEFVSESADVRQQAAGSGENLEQEGREQRYQFFGRLVREGRFQKIALGHTLSDQAETVLFRLLRGSGTAGLAGIHPMLEGGIVRPLIETGRHEVIQFLRSRGRTWREDPSNLSRDFTRNRLRHDLLPLLAKEWNPEITPALAQLADWARDEEAYWQDELRRLIPAYARREGEAIYLDAAGICAVPAAVERRLLREIVRQVRGDLREIQFLHIEQILRLAASDEGHGRVQIPGVDVFRSFGQIRFSRPQLDSGLENRNFALPLAVPGIYEPPRAECRFVFKLVTQRPYVPGYNRDAARLDWDRTPRPLWLRNWRPGDQYHPVGFPHLEKLKVLFQQSKVPLWERSAWPVVVCRDAAGERIVWTRRFGPAAEFSACETTENVLEITEVRR